MFFYILLFIHSALCLSLVFLVLLQQGKGADAGATFGGGNSNSVLGVGGAADFITKLTTSLAIAFMVTSILLVRAYQDRGVLTTGRVADPLQGSVLEGVSDIAPAENAVSESGAVEVIDEKVNTAKSEANADAKKAAPVEASNTTEESKAPTSAKESSPEKASSDTKSEKNPDKK